MVRQGVAVALALAAFVGQAVAEPQPLRIGSKRFTEAYVLGEILRQQAQSSRDARVSLDAGLGNTGIVFAALQSGNIDVYPEYTGTISREILKDESLRTLAAINERLRPLGLAAGVPLGFGNTYALAVRGATAAKLGLRRLSDLAAHPELRIGVSNEFLGRADGWPGLRAAYGLPHATPRGLDHGIALDALRDGVIDVTDIYSTDAKIERLGLVVLADDRRYFPEYDAVLLYRSDVPQRVPGAWAAIEGLRGRIDAATMTHLNAEAELDGKPFADVAAGFLQRAAPAGAASSPPARAPASFADRLFGGDFWRLTAEHVGLVAGSLLLSVALGVPLGIRAASSTTAERAILGTLSVVQTIPALALLAFLIPVFHRIGAVPTLVALFLYALLPIVRNTHSGLKDIAPSLVESAQALGLPKAARLRLIELPLAAPSILAGIKTSAVINVGNATIAAFIGAGGYGERIASGLALNDNAMLLAGAIPSAVLALLVEAGFVIAERRFMARSSAAGKQARAQ
jgi:osmoprotectant transport system permease protein